MLEYGTSQKCVTDSTSGVPVLRMGNIQHGQLDFGDLKYCSVDGEIIRLMLEPGDLLFNRTNSPELVGKSAVYQSDVPASFASYLIRVRFDNRAALPEFVNYWLNSAWGRAWAQLAKTDGVSQSNINGSKLALMPVLLPPIDEQGVIVERVSRMLMVADAIHARVESASSAVDKSSQAVLAKAFRGQLALAAPV
jgi:type I restriction enzyme S subunit